MFLATIVNRFGDFIGPFLALYLTKRLGYDSARAGVVVFVAFSASAVGVLFSGRVADAIGRKGALAATHASAGLFALATSFFFDRSWSPVLIVAGSLFRGSARPLISALIADIAPAEKRKEAFGLQYWSINVGVAVGPLVAAYLFDRDMAWLFRGDALCSLASSALILLGVRTPARPRAGSDLEREDSRGALKAFLARPILPAYCLLSMLAAFTYSQTGFSMSLTMSDAFGDAGTLFLAKMISLNAITVIVLSIPLARLFRRRRPLWCMGVAGGIYIVGFGMLAFRLGEAWIAASTFIWTIGEIVHSVNMGVFVSRHSPANWRGSFQSFTSAFSQAGHSLGPLAAGPVIGSAGYSVLWACTAAACGLWGLGAVALDRKDAGSASEEA
jgi:MFS family permease